MDISQGEELIGSFYGKGLIPMPDQVHSLLCLNAFEQRLPIEHRHSINLFSLVRAAGDRLGIAPVLLAEICNAILTHDIGKLDLPAALFDGHDFLPGSKDYDLVKEHALIGFRKLAAWNWFKACVAGAHHNGHKNGYGLRIRDPETVEGQKDLAMIAGLIARSEIKPRVRPEDAHWIVRFISIADFTEKFFNSKLKLQGVVKGTTIEEILFNRYPGYRRFIEAVLAASPCIIGRTN